MTEINKGIVENALKQIIDPNTDEDPVSSKSVKKIEIEGGRVTIDLTLGYPAKSWTDEYSRLLVEKVESLEGVDSAVVNIGWDIVTHAVQKGVKPIPGVRNMIAIASGKGGVGKSTLAVNLALSLSAEGASVGLLDADIYGPSQPRMLGVSSQPESRDGKTMEPLNSYHIQAMSIGFLIDEETPMIWRGPMVTQALEQLMRDTRWDDLDYLIIDLPPGTGDVQLTLAQKVPVTGALIVTTPQDIALLDARKAYKMFEQVEIPVIGLVENMSTHVCSECGHEEHIFGKGGGKRLAEEYGVEHLGDVPLDLRIREDVDLGKPTIVADPESAITNNFKRIARRVAGKLSVRSKDYTEAFPSIVIQNN